MDLENLFLKLGYTKEEYEKIVSSYQLNRLKKETLYDKVLENYKFLLSLGYTREEVIRMTKTLPSIYGYSIENMKQKIEDIMLLGYTREDVIKITKTLPSIYGYSIENMKQKIIDIMSLGYTREEVIRMTKTLPSLYAYSIENMKQKIEDIMSLGYTREEVIKMTKSHPTLYGYSIENIRQKITFYDSIDMHELAIIDSKRLIQSVDLSYARYIFYREKGIEISMNNYGSLFISNKQFEKSYGITKKELLEKYNYRRYMEEQNDRII